MLFNSYAFIFLFLPVTLFVFFTLGRKDHGIAAAWLALASLFFYGWWNPAYVGLLLASILTNYVLGIGLVRARGAHWPVSPKWLLIVGLALNLLILGYYKYANFFLVNINGLSGTNWNLGHIVLPLGISFFTFTQIAFLVDTYQGKVKEYNFIHYSLFVTYFPHLIAGPVLHHKEMMPQFARAGTYKFNYENVAVGLTIFSIGLFKKVIMADSLAPYVSPVFDAPYDAKFTLFEAWGGALSYTFQLYFDFSGYSDMAIGLSYLFGVKLPLNFHSPYQAVNIIDFWRRWHMTLSRFLRDYLYIPLGGNRKGPTRRYANLMATMLLGGLWHGAGWTFVIWGGLHGLYLAVNHGWHALRRHILGHDMGRPSTWGRRAGWFVTFIAVVVAWVFFRAGSVHAAMAVLEGMVGLNGIALPETALPRLGEYGIWLSNHGVGFSGLYAKESILSIKWIIPAFFLVLLFPNAQQFMASFKPVLSNYNELQSALRGWLLWKPTWVWAMSIAAIGVISLLSINKVSSFLYFQF